MASQHGQINEVIPATGVDKRRSTAAGNNSPTTKLVTIANYSDRNSMEAYLLTQGYSQAQLNIRNLNDLVYAVRRAQDSAGI